MTVTSCLLGGLCPALGFPCPLVKNVRAGPWNRHAEVLCRVAGEPWGSVSAWPGLVRTPEGILPGQQAALQGCLLAGNAKRPQEGNSLPSPGSFTPSQSLLGLQQASVTICLPSRLLLCTPTLPAAGRPLPWYSDVPQPWLTVPRRSNYIDMWLCNGWLGHFFKTLPLWINSRVQDYSLKDYQNPVIKNCIKSLCTPVVTILSTPTSPRMSGRLWQIREKYKQEKDTD